MSIGNFIRSLLRDERGSPTVEFALAAPILITLLIGSVELVRITQADIKTDSAAITLADLSTQFEALSAAEITTIFDVVRAIMHPLPVDTLELTITSIEIDGDGNASVAWSEGSPASTERSVGSSFSLPAGIVVNNSSLILAELRYELQTPGALILPSVFTFDLERLAKPRRTNAIIGPDAG